MNTASPEAQARSFDPPQEPDWHRMIAEAAYYLAQKRGFTNEHALDDWLEAEQEVRHVISPNLDFEVTMNDATRQDRRQSDAKGPPGADRERPPNPSKQGQTPLGARMADRK